MSELRPRVRRGRPASIARHGRLPRRGPVRTLVRVLAAALGVVLVSGASVAAIAAWDVRTSLKPSVHLVDANGETQEPSTAAMDGAFNVLLAGSDSGDGNPIYGERGENLNDVTMVMHVSADHKQATVVSFPRDMEVPIPSCPDPEGGRFSAMSRQKLNNSLSYGGLPCTVLTIEKLTGMNIPYAAVVEFDGVVSMSRAIGGVPVCVAGPIDDPHTNLHLTAGEHTLEGQEALAFLRTRHGVGDGSDLGRISNQQVFLSSLVRTVKSAGTLTNPGKVYGLAKAAARNMTLSESLDSVPTMVSMAVALKNVNPADITFVQYPNHYVEGGGAVEPTEDAAEQLVTALKNDTPLRLTGDTGVGSEAASGADAQDGSGDDASSGGPDGTGSADGGADGSGPGGAGADGKAVLPDSVHGQTAAQQTCSRPYED